IIHVFIHKNESVFRYHLIASIVLFLLWSVIGFTELNMYFDHLEGYHIMLCIWIPPAVLAVYFWFITFTEFSVSVNKSHSYLDL
ncbi:MAG: hypothetical protein KJP21_03575, partial [Bacteroidia bacterium]|nr:hypothetical protein [Bacteroidia bacterium]